MADVYSNSSDRGTRNQPNERRRSFRLDNCRKWESDRSTTLIPSIVTQNHSESVGKPIRRTTSTSDECVGYSRNEVRVSS